MCKKLELFVRSHSARGLEEQSVEKRMVRKEAGWGGRQPVGKGDLWYKTRKWCLPLGPPGHGTLKHNGEYFTLPNMAPKEQTHWPQKLYKHPSFPKHSTLRAQGGEKIGLRGGGGEAFEPIFQPPHHGLPSPPPYYAWGGGV